MHAARVKCAPAVDFARVARDAHYAYGRLAWLLRPYNVSRSAYVAAHARVAMHFSFATAVAWPMRPLQWLRFFEGLAM